VIASVAYRPFGPAETWREGNGAAFIRAFDTDGRIAAIGLGATTKDPATTTIAYTYDLASRITGMTETGRPDQAYGYDALDRLTGFVKGSGTEAESTAYAYDPDGNRVAQTKTGREASTTAYRYAATSNRLLQTEQGSHKSTLSYDAAGNLVSDGTRQWSYDARGRMASVLADNEATEHANDNEKAQSKRAVIYAVNGLGQHVAKRTGDARAENATVYATDEAGHVLGTYDARGRAVEETVYLGDLPVVVLDGRDSDRDDRRSYIFYIASDQLGAPHIITNAQGHEIWSWQHGPFGTGTPRITIEQADLLYYDHRFPGQMFDEETGLHQNGFRDYDPALGRYIESDPMGLAAGVNTYGYVGGNPVTGIDPFGLLGINDQMPSSMPSSIPCPSPSTCAAQPNVWNPGTSADKSLYHDNMDLYKQIAPAQQWGSECTYSKGQLVTGTPTSGTANYWPDWTFGHFFLDPGGPRLVPPLYQYYWNTHPHPPGID
jgi:RHS repeat-associated protein